MTRLYPPRPIVGILSVVRRQDRFLLVRRANPPNQGRWGFPGGVQELGETLFEAAIRELAEETGVRADPIAVLTAFDGLDRDESGAVRHHYTLIAVTLDWREGEGEAGDDAAAVGWYRLDEIDRLDALPAVGPLMIAVLSQESARSGGVNLSRWREG